MQTNINFFLTFLKCFSFYCIVLDFLNSKTLITSLTWIYEYLTIFKENN